MEATAWKEDCYTDKHWYRLQISDVPAGTIKKLQKIVSDWEASGSGWNSKNSTALLLFSKRFESEKEWIEWAKHFPYKLVELNRKGNPKRTKLGIAAQKKMKKGDVL